MIEGYGELRAHFLDATTLAWPPHLGRPSEGSRWELYAAPRGGIAVADGAVVGGTRLGQLAVAADGLTAEQLTVRGHLRNFIALRLGGVERSRLEEALTGQVMVALYDPDGVLRALTGVQIPGVLDALYACEARAGKDLGLRYQDGVPTLTLWAPTARSVALNLYPAAADGHAAPQILPLRRQPDGTWVARGERSWTGRQYTFTVEVYVPSTGRVETNTVTDPYSVGLTVNSTRSVFVDLADPAWAPPAWTHTPAPRLDRPAQQTIYELHVRDFSSVDEALPDDVRGTYAAFGHPDSSGTRHLRELADAGITTVHLLPTFDIATIEEDRAQQKQPQIPTAGPSSATQQAAVMATADQDAYNWGYDPYHFMTAEGSYALPGHQEGGERTAQFRSLIASLHGMGLQVVLDQVYNHTAAHGQAEHSVLDRIVPGYYHRLDAAGAVENSTCCSNLATEHQMAEQLMIDSTTLWARHYRIDGFRFDLMGHHSRANMEAVRSALNELTLEKDGVDGSALYLYGEGWNFGEVQDNARFIQATQGQLEGTSIGAFNDRLRDAVHGGQPFDIDKRLEQGYGTGLFTFPNGFSPHARGTQLTALRRATDLVRLSLAGNLRDYTFLTTDGVKSGAELDYRGEPAGYATRPEESVNYVDAHDNETLWDLGVWKLPDDTPRPVRVRAAILALATVTLGQSPSFWHAGTELLRSKSLDRDSYNSGDHFNAVDWTGQTSGFGRGLPPEEDNGSAWDLMRPMLEDPRKTPTAPDIAAAREAALDLLRLRSSSPLFTLGEADLIQRKVTFPNGGPEATPGLLVMRIDDTVGPAIDPQREGIVVVFNASPEPITEAIDGMEGTDLQLSRIQREGADAVVRQAGWENGTVTVPAFTVAVFEALRNHADSSTA